MQTNTVAQFKNTAVLSKHIWKLRDKGKASKAQTFSNISKCYELVLQGKIVDQTPLYLNLKGKQKQEQKTTLV